MPIMRLHVSSSRWDGTLGSSPPGSRCTCTRRTASRSSPPASLTVHDLTSSLIAVSCHRVSGGSGRPLRPPWAASPATHHSIVVDLDGPIDDDGVGVGPGRLVLVIAALFAVAAADWLSGSCLIAGGWRQMRVALGEAVQIDEHHAVGGRGGGLASASGAVGGRRTRRRRNPPTLTRTSSAGPHLPAAERLPGRAPAVGRHSAGVNFLTKVR